MSYKVVKETVIHSCPTCGVELENPLSQAGQNDTCPQCRFSFVVPGEKELREQEGRITAREQKEKALIKRQQEEAERRQEEAAKEARRAVEEAVRQAERERKQNEIASNPVRTAPVPILAKSHSDAPNYGALESVGKLCEVTGILSIIGGFFCLIFTLTQDVPPAMGLPLFVGGIIYGVFAFGMGQAVYALRHMAINSFHSVETLREIFQKVSQRT